MYLKRLEISGFKSFAQKTVLDFDKGITGIVGPNGSGKSNTADAVRWVMGEQSAKTLRTKKSHDVIFTGSDKKSQQSMASVCLYLDNTDKRLPLDYEEVTITRKVYRTGETEYLLNKSKARLLDIVELLAKGGVGQRGYVVISQGMADAILKASPQELRTIFEDASGVKLFQIRKNEALRKLNHTEENILRVNDLLNEITPRLKNLKRLAKKALEKDEVEKQLKTLQDRWYRYSLGKLLAENLRFDTDINRFKADIEKLSKEIEESKASVGDFYQKQEKDDFADRVEAEIEGLERKRNELYRKIASASGNIELEKEKMKMKSAPKTVPINLGYIRTAISGLLVDYRKIAGEIRKLTEDSKAKTMDAASAGKVENNLKAIEERLAKISEEVERGKVQVSDPMQDEEMKKEIEQHQKVLVELEKAVTDLQGALSALEKDIAIKRQSIRKHAEEKQARQQEFFAKERQWRAKESDLMRLKDKMRSVEIDKTRVDTRMEDLIREINAEAGAEFLNKLKEDLAKIPVVENLSFGDEENLRTSVQRLKFKLVEVGGIDPMVVKEYEDTNKRYEFLTTQTADLREATQKLNSVITELDGQIVVQFNEAYKKINEEFDKYFKIIFGGGNASLNKKTEVRTETGGVVIMDDESEEDKYIKVDTIEIKANPPGKRVKDIALLSGGERALTSVALLFAIISNNPPPFVILDEIDAALDEANSGRFGRILQELSDKTQFIVITHNRETMRQAKALYGVTMGDDSVSRVLSIKLEQNIKTS